MKKLILLALFIFLFAMAVPVLAQQVDTSWVRRYDGAGGDDRANALVVDGFGNVYVTGFMAPAPGATPDYATVKYGPDGTQLWVRTYNDVFNGPDLAVAIALDGFGNICVTGYVFGGANMDYVTIKYDPNGNQLWLIGVNRGGTDMARDIATDAAGNVYVTGISWNLNPMVNNIDFLTQKYTHGGGVAWTQAFNGNANGDDSASAIAVDNSGNVFVVGQCKMTQIPPINRAIALVKYDAAGNTVWVKYFSSPQGFYNDYPYDVGTDAAGNVYVTGRLGYGVNYTTVKFAPDGTMLWGKIYNGPGNSNDEARALAVDAAGNVYVTGYSVGSGTNEDYTTIKYRSNGDTAWVRRYDNPESNHDFASAIAIDNAGNVYVTGQSYSSVIGYDYATVKYDSSGNQCWVQTYNGPAGINDVALKIAVNNFGNVYVTGYSDGGATSYDYATIKYWQDYPPVVTAVDSTKFFCLADTIRFNVVATDSDATDSLTLSGPGIPVPVKGVSPLSVEAKIYVSSSGTNDYVYTVTDGRLTDSDTATWSVTINTAPAVTSADSSKMFCGPDTIRFTVTATDPNVGDSLTLSGPGIPSPIKGLSPLSANIKIYVSATGTYNYVYAVADSCGAVTVDTATWAITINTLPNPFSLTAPVDSHHIVPSSVLFEWESAIDSDTGTSLTYTLYVSKSSNFPPESTFVHDGLTASQYNDTVGIGIYHWKVRVGDGCGITWSTQTWTFLSFIRGDVNADGNVSLVDVIYLANYVLKGGPAPNPLQSGDVNCDAYYNLADVIKLARYVLFGEPFPC